MTMTKKEYTNGEITVVWQPGLCIHSGICFHSLPDVFKPLERPWVQMGKSDTASIKATVNSCPSGALSLKEVTDGDTKSSDTPVIMAQVKIMPNGPVRITGPCMVTLRDGTVVEKPNGVAICRCGGSSAYPFCDSSHKTNGFKG